MDGIRRCPPGEVGGPDRFVDFLEAVVDPAHPGTPGHGPLVRPTVRSNRVRRGAGPFRHGEHGASQVRPAGQPQERIAASETMTAASRMIGRLGPAHLAKNGQATPKASEKSPNRQSHVQNSICWGAQRNRRLIAHGSVSFGKNATTPTLIGMVREAALTGSTYSPSAS